MEYLHIQLRIHRWVIWWVFIGVLGGIIAGINMWGHNLSRAEDRILILLGAAHWLLGGIICWMSDGVEIEPQQSPAPPTQELQDPTAAKEYHPASDFLLPGNRRSLLPWRH